MATDLGFYRAKIKIYGFLPMVKILEYYEGLECYSECTIISKVIDELNRKRPPNSVQIPKKIDEIILDQILAERQKDNSDFDMSDLLELIDVSFEKILVEVSRENKTQSLN